MKRKTPLRAKKPMKRGYIKVKPKQGRKAAIARADRLIQEAILAISPVCEFPRCRERATEGHHIIHRRNHSVRWDTRNVIALCRKHHSYDGIANKKEMLMRACIQWLGDQEAYERLRLYANDINNSETPEQAIERLKRATR